METTGNIQAPPNWDAYGNIPDSPEKNVGEESSSRGKQLDN